MEEIRIILLSVLGLWFIVMNYRRRQGNFKHRIDDARRDAGKTQPKEEPGKDDQEDLKG